MNDLERFLGPYVNGDHHGSFIVSTIVPDRMSYWRNDAKCDPDERMTMPNIGAQLREVATAQLLADWAALTKSYHRTATKAAATKALVASRKSKGFAPELKPGERPEPGYQIVNANLLRQGQLVDTWYAEGRENLPPEMLRLLPSGTASS